MQFRGTIMSTERLTRVDVLQSLGLINELAMSQLLSMCATVGELRAALTLLDEESAREQAAAPSIALLTLLAELQPRTPEPEYLGTD
jgi:hypothetical protein